jgi:outer membrane lipoprotein SlyB
VLEGKEVGKFVGNKVGVVEGKGVGKFVGNKVGVVEGKGVGKFVGNKVGVAEGKGVGSTVGIVVGVTVGTKRTNEELNYHNQLNLPSEGHLVGYGLGKRVGECDG